MLEIIEEAIKYRDNEFVNSILRFHDKTGFITEKQEKALRKTLNKLYDKPTGVNDEELCCPYCGRYSDCEENCQSRKEKRY